MSEYDKHKLIANRLAWLAIKELKADLRKKAEAAFSREFGELPDGNDLRFVSDELDEMENSFWATYTNEKEKVD